VLAIVVDRSAFEVIRAATLYDRWGELREGLTAAKFLGSGLGTALIVLIVGVVDPIGRRRVRVLLLVVVAAGASAGLLKIVSGRERPSHLDQPLGHERMRFAGPRRGLREAPYQSFPSGHVTAATATATCLSAFYPPARVVFYAVAATAGAHRVVTHQHFLSDVVAGFVVGHLVALWLLHLLPISRWWRRETVDTGGVPP
jgi:membrane-associated phospholipid phosphatase